MDDWKHIVAANLVRLRKANGMTHRQKRATGRSEADCQTANYKRFGNDLLITEYGLHTVGKALGTEMADPEDAVPHIVKNALQDLDNVVF